MILYHGAHTAFQLHVGQCFTDDAEIARSYAGSRGIVMSIDVNFSGLVVREIDGYDHDNDKAFGDRESDKTDADIVEYRDENIRGQSHRTWRLMSEKAVGSVKILKIVKEDEDEEDSEDSTSIDIDSQDEDEQDASSKYATSKRFHSIRPVKVAPDRSEHIAKSITKAIQSSQAKMQFPGGVTSNPERRIYQDVRPNQTPWSNTPKTSNSASESRMNSPRGSASERCANERMYSTRSSGGNGIGNRSGGKIHATPSEFPFGGTNLNSPSHSQSPTQRQAISSAMTENSNKIREHEARHVAAIHEVDPNAKPEIHEAKGPDGRKHAIAGEVNTTAANPVFGNPEANERKANALYRSAMGDQRRSAEDESVGRRALEMGQEARRQKHRMRMPDIGTSGDGRDGGDEMGDVKSSPQMGMQSPRCARMASPTAAVGMIAGAARGAISVTGRAAGGIASRARSIASGGGRFAGAARVVRTAATRVRNVSRTANRGVRNFQTQANNTAIVFDNLNRSVSRTTGQFDALVNRLKFYSPEVASQVARNQVNQIQFDIQNARTLGKPLAAFERAAGGNRIATQERDSELAKIFLPFATFFTNISTGITKVEGLLLKGVNWLVEKAGGLLTSISQAAYENVPFLKTIADKISAIGKAVDKWLNDPKRQKENMQNLNDFFAIQIPQPGEKNKIAGPNFVMPIPQFKPLPMAGNAN